jgi:peptidyl-prolyl cis-trans isomerase C
MTMLGPVTVNGKVIDATRIAAEAQMHPAPKGKPGLAWTAAARALALREAMLQEARALGLVPDPQETAPGLVETGDEALIRQLLDLRLAPVPVDDSALRRVYDRDPTRFRAPTLFEASHILIAGEGPDRPAALARAVALLDQVMARPDRFEDLARHHSDCPSREAGGRLGQFGPHEMLPQVEAALGLLIPGQIAPAPVETRFGLHILRLDARADGAVLPFASVLPRLREGAEKAAWARAAQEFARTLLSSAQIKGITFPEQGQRAD